MPGYSKDLNNRFCRPWLQKNLSGSGSGSVSLPQKRHSTVVNKPKSKSKRRKHSDHSTKKRLKAY